MQSVKHFRVSYKFVKSTKEMSPALFNVSNNFKLNCLFFAAGISALALIVIGLSIAALPLLVPAMGAATTAYVVGAGVAALGAVTGLGVGAAMVKKGFFSYSSPAPESAPEVKKNSLEK